ncbi:transposase [Thermophilibacter sp.]
MVRVARQVSESGYYHVVLRGSGRQVIFEDDADRRAFLLAAQRCLVGSGVAVIAWCLMDNHAHLVVRDDAGCLSEALHRLTTSYARRYNTRTGHVGHVFQERFRSSPIEDEPYLLEAVRYIHNNPEKACLCRAEEYPWSSYADYFGHPHEELEVERGVVLGLLGGEEGFSEFCRTGAGLSYRPPSGVRLDESETLEVARRVLGDVPLAAVRTLPPARRNELLRALRDAGLSIRQVERLTGVGRNTVARA